jgi:hypothetical protein
MLAIDVTLATVKVCSYGSLRGRPGLLFGGCCNVDCDDVAGYACAVVTTVVFFFGLPLPLGCYTSARPI